MNNNINSRQQLNKKKNKSFNSRTVEARKDGIEMTLSLVMKVEKKKLKEKNKKKKKKKEKKENF